MSVVLIARVHAALDRRLEAHAGRPVGLALSGGSDSLALLHLAAAWAARRGRRLLALTVDHGLNPQGAAWTRFARKAALDADADWRGLEWRGDKPERGLPAAARAARHALIAEAARTAGARAVLFAHTADDVEESDWMRARGSTLGGLRDWSPSPAWPGGRGVMLMRPLLGERREDLRAFLRERGASWLEDPANTDPRFARARARAALSRPAEAERVGRRAGDAVGSSAPFDATAAWAGVLSLARGPLARDLAAALLCVSGAVAPPRGERLGRLLDRAGAGEAFVATLAGARVEARGGRLVLTREPGRAGLAEAALAPGESVAWDGRFEITAPGPGWRAGSLKGRMAALGRADQAIVKTLPAAARAGLPVLWRDGEPRPVLAWRAAKTRCLVAGRFLAATGGIGHEGDMGGEDDMGGEIGETPPPDLFLHEGVGRPPHASIRGLE